MADEFLAPVKASQQKPEATQLLTAFFGGLFPKDPKLTEEIANKLHIRPSTARGYQARWRQLKPWCHAGDGKPLRLRDTGTADVQRILDWLAEQTKLNHSSIRSLRNLLNGGFSYAIRMEIVPKGFSNPVREVKLPGGTATQETYAYSLEEVRQMLAVLPEPVPVLRWLLQPTLACAVVRFAV